MSTRGINFLDQWLANNVPETTTADVSLRRPFSNGDRQMARTKPSKQLSQAEFERFLTAAEAMHWCIVKPLLLPTSDQYRALQSTQEALLETVNDITGKEAPFIQLNTTGPVRPLTEH